MASRIDSSRLASRKNSRASSSAREPAEPYHHGALRNALLQAAEAILLEQGVEGFTLRACARRAGVSHAAPAHHFGDVQGLLTEFAAIGFERMRAMMARYREAAGGDPGAQLRAAGQAYIDFAVANRAHFQLMFRQDRLARDSERLRSTGQAAFDELRSVLAAAAAAYADDAEEFSTRLVLAWSAVHGFATLLLEYRFDGFRRRQGLEPFARRMGERMLKQLEAGLLGEAAA